jgi:hypothetical protein
LEETEKVTSGERLQRCHQGDAIPSQRRKELGEVKKRNPYQFTRLGASRFLLMVFLSRRNQSLLRTKGILTSSRIYRSLELDPPIRTQRLIGKNWYGALAMKVTTRLLILIVGGGLTTALTGAINSAHLYGAAKVYAASCLETFEVHYGVPFPWLTLIIRTPGYYPSKVDLLSLLADIVLWSVTFGIVLFALARAKKPLR